MRFTLVLRQQNLYRMRGSTWKVQRKRFPIDLGVEEKLLNKNIEVVSALDVIQEKKEPLRCVETT